MNSIARTNRLPRIAYTAFIAALMGLAMVALAACGSATTVQPTAQPTSVATIVVPIATATVEAVATADVGDMGEMPTALPPVATSATSAPGAASTAAPTQAPMGQGGAGAGAGSGMEIQATLKEWSLTLSQGEVSAGKILFTVTNEGQFAHNLTVTDSSGEIAMTPTFSRADGVQTLEVDLKPGTYTIICNLRGHAARGQTAQLVVK